MKQSLEKYSELVIGSILLSLGIYLFVTPAGLNFGGVIGTSQILEFVLKRSFSLPSELNLMGWINFAINVPLFLLGWRVMSKEFCVKTLLSLIIQTVTLSILPKQATLIMPDLLSNAIFGALMCGFGVGLALHGSGCCGGIDIVGVCLSKLKPGFSVGKVSILINAVVFSICAYLYDLQTSLYSIIFVAILYLVSDRIHYQNINVTALIFTKDPTMKERIMKEIGRGLTYWMGKGAYTETERYILFCAVNKYEVRHLKKVVRSLDPQAFVVLSEDQEISGGFEKRL